MSIFLYKFYNKLLLSVSDNYFLPSKALHNYNTRLSSRHACTISNVKTNYGIFNIEFAGSKVWMFARCRFPRGGGGGVTWVNFCWVCAAGFSEPLTYYRLFCGQLMNSSRLLNIKATAGTFFFNRESSYF